VLTDVSFVLDVSEGGRCHHDDHEIKDPVGRRRDSIGFEFLSMTTFVHIVFVCGNGFERARTTRPPGLGVSPPFLR